MIWWGILFLKRSNTKKSAGIKTLEGLFYEKFSHFFTPYLF